MSAPRLAILADFLEEGWPSMDLVGEQLFAHLGPARLEPTFVRPPFVRRFSPLGRRGRTIDWVLNRYRDYPRNARRLARSFDAFHVVDHSYAQLVHALPEARTGVFCHDLDAFECVLEPRRAPRSVGHRELARRQLRGLAKAAVVFVASKTLEAQIVRYGVVDPGRIVLVAPYGVAREFLDAAVAPPPPPPAPFVLHVGSCIPRKRVDVLLEVFARLRARRRDLRLVQIGGTWTEEHRAAIARLSIEDAVSQRRGLDRAALALAYRQASAVLLPTEREGFGLPLIEALACGAIVVASDLEVLREVGGDAGVYCPVADVEAWVETVDRLLADPASAPARERRLARGRQFEWSAHARTIAAAYRRLLGLD